ncbi:MAG: hypothetical protein KBS81_06350 [Spirochaetales bacterium]|nr:hypothetical protein [Candidatus Physcosoma equi]
MMRKLFFLFTLLLSLSSLSAVPYVKSGAMGISGYYPELFGVSYSVPEDKGVEISLTSDDLYSENCRGGIYVADLSVSANNDFSLFLEIEDLGTGDAVVPINIDYVFSTSEDTLMRYVHSWKDANERFSYFTNSKDTKARIKGNSISDVLTHGYAFNGSISGKLYVNIDTKYREKAEALSQTSLGNKYIKVRVYGKN